MTTSITSRTLARPVVSKNESTGECQSDAVVSKNETIIINTTNETDKETINDTSSGAVQRTDEKKAKGDTGGFFEKNSPRPP